MAKMKDLKTEYQTKFKKELQKELDIKNVMSVPKLEKIVINVGLGEAIKNPAAIDNMVRDLTLIAGQQAVVTSAKTAISNFKIREGDKVGVKVTLRKQKMWDFYEKLVRVVLPRVKDFRGVSPKAFDGRGNYSLGMTEHTVFLEVDSTKTDRIRGLQVNIITSATNDEYGKALLTKLGMPFKKK